MSILLRASENFKPVSDNALLERIVKSITEGGYQNYQEIIINGHDKYVGSIRLVRSPKYQGYVIELVRGNEGDSITTLFVDTDVFKVKERYVQERLALIREFKARLMILSETVFLDDESRGRKVTLEEMSTAQLVDVVLDLSMGGRA